MDHEVTFDVIIKNRNVVVSSLNVADIFHKQHKNILRDIDNLKADWKELVDELGSLLSPVDSCPEISGELTSKMRAVPKFKDCFFESNYLTKDGRTVRSYNMNRTGFTLLANGFNGKKALRFKLAYISRFDEMEEELVKRNTLYEMELTLRNQLTDTIQHNYVGDSKRLSRAICRFTNLLYIVVLGNKASKVKKDRGFGEDVSVFADIMTSAERSKYMEKENDFISYYRSGVTDYYELKDLLLDKKLGETA